MRLFLLFLFLFFFLLSVVSAAANDVELIIEKLKGIEPEPKDPRTVQQVYEGLQRNDQSQLLTRVTDETLVQPLWDQIMTQDNRKDLLAAGLSEQKSEELLEVWDTLEQEHDFIIKKMDELSEQEMQLKEGFNAYMEEYITRENPGLQPFEFEWKELQQYTLEHQEQTADPEHIKVNYNDGDRLFLPLTDLPQGLTKITVNQTGFVYDHRGGGAFYVDVPDVYPTSGGTEREWFVEGFKDLAQNPYDVRIDFGSDSRGEITAYEGGFHVLKDARVELDNRYSKLYYLKNLHYDAKSFITMHNDGLYVFRGILEVLFSRSGNQYNITDYAVDRDGVLTDLEGARSARVSGYEYKYVAFNDDSLHAGDLLLQGNADRVVGRKIVIHTVGVGYDFPTIQREMHSGFIVPGNSVLLSQGFIHAQRSIPGMSDVYLSYSRVGSTLVDVTHKRGSENGGLSFIDFFRKQMFIIDRIFNYTLRRTILSPDGFFI